MGSAPFFRDFDQVFGLRPEGSYKLAKISGIGYKRSLGKMGSAPFFRDFDQVFGLRPEGSHKLAKISGIGYKRLLGKLGKIGYMTVLDVAYGAADRASGKGDGLGDSGPRPEPEPAVEIEFACRGGAAPIGIASSAGMPMGPAERLGEAARALPRFMPAPAGQDDGSDEEDDEEDVDILTIGPPLPTTPPPLPLTPPPPAPVPEEERPAKRRCLHAPTGKHYKYCELQRATDKDKKKYGWQESDGPAIKVVWQDLETKHRSLSLEPLDYVLTWQEEDGHYADLHWRRTIMEEVMGKSTPYRPVGDSSVVSRAGACSAGTAVAQRFRLDKPYACLAMALFNLCNAPKRYKEKLRSEFKRSVDCYPIFYEYLNELEKQGRALAIVSREPLKKRGTGWLFDGTAPLGILVHKGHAYGIDPARQLVFDCKSTVARPLTDLAAIGIHASNTPYEWLTVTPL
eukprot:g43567.t1